MVGLISGEDEIVSRAEVEKLLLWCSEKKPDPERPEDKSHYGLQGRTDRTTRRSS